jgi:ferredoxin-NADP reductase
VSAPEPFPTRLLSFRDESQEARTFRFEVPGSLAFTPGMWLMFYFPDALKEGRAYSLCSSPLEKGWVEVTVSRAGAFTERMRSLREGDAMLARGPLGKWVFDETAPKSVLVSEGSGVAPFRSMCLYATAKDVGHRVTLLCSAATREALLYRGEFDEWRRAGVAVKERAGEHVTAAEAFAAGGREAVYYLCGSNELVESLRTGLKALGAAKVRHEKWGEYDLKF